MGLWCDEDQDFEYVLVRISKRDKTRANEEINFNRIILSKLNITESEWNPSNLTRE